MSVDKEEIEGSEYLEFVEPHTLEELKEKGYEIISILNGFKVYIRKIGDENADEEEGFGEDVDEAAYNALPMEAYRGDLKRVIMQNVELIK
jgi:hypothetical protein